MFSNCGLLYKVGSALKKHIHFNYFMKMNCLYHCADISLIYSTPLEVCHYKKKKFHNNLF